VALPAAKADFLKALCLDTNFWIGLAQAHHGRLEGARFGPALAAITNATSKGTLLVPVLPTPFLEVGEVADPGRRERLREARIFAFRKPREVNSLVVVLLRSRVTILASLIAFSSALPGCSSSGGGTVQSTPEPPPPGGVIPAAVGACPTIQTTAGVVDMLGLRLQLWVGEKRPDVKGPVLFFWHGTGDDAAQAETFMHTQIDEIVSEGGMVVSFETSLGTGTFSGPLVWYSDDYGVADTLLACANQQLNIDKRRIYSAGCSAGGLQTGGMAFARSSYIASAMTISGGHGGDFPLQDPAHVPAVTTGEGREGADIAVIDFTAASKALATEIVNAGGFAVDCVHPNAHCGSPQDLIAAQWRFLKDHPFGTTKDPYAGGLPASFPTFCQKAFVGADR
jgi:hypothetical protein